MRVYVAGKMSGEPNNGFDLFDSAAAYLRALGHDVVNPAEIDRSLGYDGSKVLTPQERKDVLRRDYFELVSCDAIALLHNWSRSVGARGERRVAEECGIDVWNVDPWVSFKAEAPTILVAIAGYAQTGKDTSGAMMVEHAGFTRLAFADALKSVTLASRPKIAEFVRTAGWEETKRQYPESRIFLQHLGVAVREHVDPNAWVNAVLRQVAPGGRYCVTDCRFPNEAAAVKALGGYVVRVERPGTGPVNAHASETALDDWDFDAILRNTGTLDDLRSRVRIFLSTLA
jgi:hypothetical protein